MFRYAFLALTSAAADAPKAAVAPFTTAPAAGTSAEAAAALASAALDGVRS